MGAARLRHLAAGAAGGIVLSVPSQRRSRCDGTDFTPSPTPSVPFWLCSSRWEQPPPIRTSAELPKQVEVVVIGAGLAGAGCTYNLVQRKVQTLLLDARDVSGGASGRNGGFLGGVTWRQLPAMLLEEDAKFSLQTFALKLANLRQVRQLCTELNVDADLDQNVDGVKVFATEGELLAQIGWWRHFRFLLRLLGVHILIGKSEMQEHLNLKEGCSVLNSAGCVRLHQDFDTICSARFVIAVVNRAVELGAQVHTHTRVLHVEPTGNGEHIVHTERGAVRCQKVVFATNAYTGSLLPVLADKIRPVRNHVLVTTPAPPLLHDGSRCGFGSNQGFNYWIQRADGRVVLGGFRDKEPDKGVDIADDSTDDPAARSAIRTFLFENFEMGNAQIEQEWTGIIGWSCDDSPWVGPVPGQPGAFVCAGFCGSGVSRAFMCGSSVADMVVGEAPRYFVDRYMPDFSRHWTADTRAGHAVTPGR